MKRIHILILALAVTTISVPLLAAPENDTNGARTQISLQERDKIRQDNFNTFLKETAELRQELAEKQTESQKLLLAEKPDRSKIAMVSEQIYQLIDTIQEKAQAAGVEQGLGSGSGGCGCRQRDQGGQGTGTRRPL